MLRSFLLAILCAGAALAQADKPPAAVVAGIPVNYEEAKVGTYTLPNPLVLANGKPVRDAKTWNEKRRPEIVKLFEESQYGRAPGRPAALRFVVNEAGAPALDGKAIRRQVTIFFSADDNGPKMDLLLYLPAGAATRPVPVLLNAAFSANSNTVADSGVKVGEVWGPDKKKVPATQGRSFGKVNVARLIDSGFGFATVYYGDIDPDFLGGVPLGVRALYLKPGQSEPAPDEWGSISAWAWGLSRAMDYLETDRGVDAKRVAITGVSRLGKTVMWAGAHDQRFALVIASCSGEGGAALSRRNYGETIAHLTEPTRYPYQFAANYAKFGQKVDDEFPVDANLLVALIAPRPVLLQTGDKDFWSDPKGEFLAARAADPVYRLLGKQGLETDEMPPAGTPILHTIGYYMHAGGHGTIPSDWDQYLAFLRMHLGGATHPLKRRPKNACARLYLLLAASVLLVRAADTGMAGPYAGDWKSDSSGSGGAIHMTLTAAPDASWKCDSSFSLSGEEVKTKVQSFKLDNSQLDVAYDFEIQGIIARSKLTGKWDGKTFTGRYQTAVVDTGGAVDAGTWNAARSK